jgi:uncharacterized protein (DUF885 family)
VTDGPFEIGERLVDDFARLRPLAATELGIAGHDDRWTDFSPDGADQLAECFRGYRRDMAVFVGDDDVWRRHAARTVVAWLDERLSEHEAGDHLRDLSHAAGTIQDIRDIFDQMDKETAAGWGDIATRMESVGGALESHRVALEEGRRQGLTVARRQVLAILEQLQVMSDDGSPWDGLEGQAAAAGFADASSRLAAARPAAKAAIADMIEYVEDIYLPAAPIEDGVGEERYLRAADRFLGVEIDPVETYAWGWEEVGRLEAEMELVAEEVAPGLGLAACVELLETDPDRAAPSHEAFLGIMQELQDQALEKLSGLHFDVDERIRRVTINLWPPGGALGANYIGPSEDFSRPGSVWYALDDRQQVPLWQEVSTAFHEGFPGHHLQVGTAMLNAANLDRTHRLLIWYSGYGEGWALYAERLMQELQLFEKPEYVLGQLATQMLRACRVVIDIGCHLGYRIPSGYHLMGGEEWGYDQAVRMMEEVALQPRSMAESEVKRYLGWPGQAISYKIGEREILDLRRREEARLGTDFVLKDFHSRLLNIGEVRLDYLGEALLLPVSNRAAGASDTG